MLRLYVRSGLVFVLISLLISLSACETSASQSTVSARNVTTPAPTATPGLLPGNDWMQYRYDSAAYGASPEHTITSAMAPGMVQRWVTGGIFGGHSFESTPAIYNGTIYLTNGDSLIALDLRTGKELWRYNDSPASKSPNLSSSVAIDSQTGIVYYGTTDARVFAVSIVTHQSVWQVSLRQGGAGYIWSSPLLVHGLVYIGLASQDDHPCVRGAAYALNAATGKTVWVHYTVSATQLGGSVWSSITADADAHAVLVTTGNACDYPANTPVQGGESNADQDAILALNWDTGATIWRYTAVPNDAGEDLDFGQGAITYTLHGRKFVVAGNKLGKMYALNPPTSGNVPSLAWSRAIAIPGFFGEGGIYTPPTYQNGIIYVAGGPTPDNTCKQGAIWALRAETGDVVWKQCTTSQVAGPPSITGDVMLVGMREKVVAYNTLTGKVLWQGALNGDVWGGVSISHGYIVVGTVTGNSRLYCFGLPTSKP